MNPSGGLVWHWHAWRHQHAWQESINQVGQWLEETPTPSKELVLIGASAGWMMPSAWLQRFEKVTTFDIDFFAAPLFRRRHGPALKASGTQLRCHTADALTHLQPLLRAHNHASILFDNVLGQVRFHHPSVDEASQRIEAITKALRGRSWGSSQPMSNPPAPKTENLANTAPFFRRQPHENSWLCRVRQATQTPRRMARPPYRQRLPRRHFRPPHRLALQYALLPLAPSGVGGSMKASFF